MGLNIPRPEYPRPDFERTQWLNLNGQWDFEFDDRDVGEREKWYINKDFSKKIVVPFCFQSEASGINDKDMHEVFWYKKEFMLPESFSGKRVLLNFGAVDYFAKVWINGELAGSHKGGHVPFKVEISRFLKEGTNTIFVRVEDRYETIQPRGKQYWKQKPDRCWYTPTSGIWQTVWLEAVGKACIEKIRLTPDIDRRNVLAEIFIDGMPGKMEMSVTVSYKNLNATSVKKFNFDVTSRISRFMIDIEEIDDIDEIHYWTPENPNLYDIHFELFCDSNKTDFVKSYFGMRKISVKGDMILLNNSPYYQKLILDQGYWPESLLTPPSDEAIIYDIEMTKPLPALKCREFLCD